ncbi:unnamed protein product [Rhodiola kirilowii]
MTGPKRMFQPKLLQKHESSMGKGRQQKHKVQTAIHRETLRAQTAKTKNNTGLQQKHKAQTAKARPPKQQTYHTKQTTTDQEPASTGQTTHPL